MVTDAVRANPKRVVFAEGEEDSVIRAAAAFQNSGMGKAILVGRADVVKAGLRARRHRRDICWKSGCRIRPRKPRPISTRSTSASSGAARCTATPCAWSPMTATSMPPPCSRPGDADAMVTGVTRNYANALADVRTVLDPPPGQRPIGMQVVFAKGRIVFIADTSVTEMPTAEQLADIAMQGAAVARRFGLTPRVALLASSTFGFPALGTQRAHHRGGADPGRPRRGF